MGRELFLTGANNSDARAMIGVNSSTGGVHVMLVVPTCFSMLP